MNLLSFYKNSPDEDACIKHLKEQREQTGIVCSKCGCTHHYWKSYRNQWQCKQCGHRTGLKAGTVVHGSNLQLLYWFIAIYLLTSTKKSFSAAELQRQLGHKRYQPIWERLYKLRNAMGPRDPEYKFVGSIELDEGILSTSVDADEKDKPRKRWCGSQEPTKKHKLDKAVGHIKMIVIDDLKSKTLGSNVIKFINNNAELATYDSTSYVNFKNIVQSHISQVVEPKQISKVLPRVHIAINNAKRLQLDNTI